MFGCNENNQNQEKKEVSELAMAFLYLELGNCFWLFCIQFSSIVGFESKNWKKEEEKRMENQDF